MSPEAEPPGSVELTLRPDDLPRLPRVLGVTPLRPPRPVSLVWHDSPDGALASQDLCLVRDDLLWRLHRLRPGSGHDWPVSSPPPVLAEAPSPALLEPAVPFDAAPVAAFQGRRRTYRRGGAELLVLHGNLRGVVADRPVCRLTLTGPAAELGPFAQDLGAALRVGCPRSTLALEASALIADQVLPPRHLGAPVVAKQHSVSDSLAVIIAHLLDALLHWADRCGTTASLEPVHQARVATRRLRSALSIYKHVAACPELDALAPALKDCASRLGAARDWDVFLAGTGALLAANLPGDPRIEALLRVARRRRAAVYDELRQFLASPAFRALELALSCAASLRPWQRVADPATLQQDITGFAAQVLGKRMKRVRRAGKGLAGLPVPALHELRKDCKRLRYAAEFFSALFPHQGSKAFLKRLAHLQEELGLLNDAATASGLMAQLGRGGRGYAAGMVEGWAASSAGSARAEIVAAWKRFRSARPFWPG